MDYLKGLNKEQKEAVLHKNGPCLVIAGAGSGKTKVLTTRIAHLINEGVSPYNILAITFTNKAAKEMRYRLDNMVSDNFSFVGTFHSFGVRIIRENYELLGLERNFSIVDSDDSLSIIKKSMKHLAIDTTSLSPSYVRNRISFIKNEMLSDKEIDKLFLTPTDEQVVLVYRHYEETLKNNNSLDFDDLLKKPVELFLNNLSILEKYQEKYQYILIDEYQDTNEVQYKLVKMLSDKYKNIFVVGDVNQSIYAFRGANYKNILNFEKDFKDALVITLNKNYRSTNNILKVANEVIKNNMDTKEVDLYSDLGDGIKVSYKRYYSDLNEVSSVLFEVRKLLEQGYKKKDIAIFYRTNAQSRLIEEEMMKNTVPYKVVGSFLFYKRKEIKDLISYLKLISNLKDNEALERIINVPKRGIGNVTVSNLREKSAEENTSMFDAISDKKELKFKEIILDIIDKSKDLSLTELIDYILDKSGMLSELENENTLESSLRIENLMEFKSITESFQKETGTINLDDFLENISLVADATEYGEDSDVVTLMTIHSAKGLEFKVVFVLGVEEGLFPHVNSLLEDGGIEEERRLCYVAITRAKERLYLSNAERRMLYGRTNVNPPSRFIDEISENLLDVEKEKATVKKVNKDLFYTSDIIDFKIGDSVIHSMYGKGSVVDVNDTIVTVFFSNKVGVKKVLKNFKGLKKL